MNGKFVNLTPHEVILSIDGIETVIPKSRGPSARLPVIETGQTVTNGVETPHVKYGPVIGLPPPCPGIIYIVSALVAASVPERTDVIAPDTGPSAIRYSTGKLYAVTRFISFSSPTE